MSNMIHLSKARLKLFANLHFSKTTSCEQACKQNCAPAIVLGPSLFVSLPMVAFQHSFADTSLNGHKHRLSCTNNTTGHFKIIEMVDQKEN